MNGGTCIGPFTTQIECNRIGCPSNYIHEIYLSQTLSIALIIKNDYILDA